MEYTWLLGVGLLMAAYQAVWWIVVGIYLFIGLALFLSWDDQDQQLYTRPRWWEYIIVAIIITLVWPIAAFTRRYCDGA